MVVLLVWFSFLFSVEAIVVEKEVVTNMSVGTTRERVTEYVTEIGIIRDIVSEMDVNLMGMVRKEKGRHTEILIYKEGKVLSYRIDHTSRTFTRSEVPAEALLGTTALIYAERIKPSEETRRVGRWRARKFVAEGRIPGLGKTGRVFQSLWLTKESDLLLEAERRKVELMRRSLRDKGAVDLIEKVTKKHGAPVMVEVRTADMTVREVVRSVSEKEIPEEKFKPPKGYKEMGEVRIRVR